jgi:hypothetical protein
MKKFVLIILMTALGFLISGRAQQNPNALPAGEYAWTIDLRCVTEELCKAAFGGESPIPAWWESFSFAGHIKSDGNTMTYAGADVFRGHAGAGADGACDAPFETAFSGVCIYGEKGEAFINTSALPSPILNGKPTIWIKNALLYSPRSSGENYVTPCPCGPEGEDEQTPATPGTYTTKDFFGGKKPIGVSLNVQLVKLP